MNLELSIFHQSSTSLLQSPISLTPSHISHRSLLYSAFNAFTGLANAVFTA